MKLAVNILRSLLLPKLEKDSNFDANKTNGFFWETFAKALLDLEKDAKPAYTAIYSLQLNDSERIISKLPAVYSAYIKELAENYVLKQTSKSTDYLLESNNETFLKEVDFLQTMQKAIKSVERKRIKADLPNSYERLTFELSENDLANAIKKKGREDLKVKFKQWDDELSDEEVPVFSLDDSKHKKESRVIQLSWMKYAVASVVIIAFGIFYFKSSESGIVPNQNSVVTAPDKKKIQKPEPIPASSMQNIVFTSNRTISIKGPASTLGYTSTETKEKISIFFKDIPLYILQYEKNIKISKDEKSATHNKLEFYKRELATLKEEKGKYKFEEGELFLYEKDAKDYAVLVTENHQYYLKRGQTYYALKVTKTPLPLEIVTDGTIIETLEKINFDNE